MNMASVAILADPLTGKYADVLTPFLALMEHELHANSGKGDRPGWLRMDRKTALLEIFYHLAKLQKAAMDDDQARIREYGADVANMAMMLVDVCGALHVTPHPAVTAPAEVTDRQIACIAACLAHGRYVSEGTARNGAFLKTLRNAVYEAALASPSAGEVAPEGSTVLSKDGTNLIVQAIGAHVAVLRYLVDGRSDLALAESKKWVEGFATASEMAAAAPEVPHDA